MRRKLWEIEIMSQDISLSMKSISPLVEGFLTHDVGPNKLAIQTIWKSEHHRTERGHPFRSGTSVGRPFVCTINATLTGNAANAAPKWLPGTP